MAAQKSVLAVAFYTLAFLFIAAPVRAQQASQADAGMTPDNPLYFMDTWSEDLSLSVTRDPQQRAEKQFDISQEKLAEVEAMVDTENASATEQAADRYSKMVSDAAQTLADAAQSGVSIDAALAELISTATAQATQRLVAVLDRVPQQAQESIKNAIQQSSTGSQQALDSVSNTDRKAAATEQVQERLESAREQAPEDVQQYIPRQVPTSENDAQGRTQDTRGTDASQPSTTEAQPDAGQDRAPVNAGRRN